MPMEKSRRRCGAKSLDMRQGKKRNRKFVEEVLSCCVDVFRHELSLHHVIDILAERPFNHRQFCGKIQYFRNGKFLMVFFSRVTSVCLSLVTCFDKPRQNNYRETKNVKKRKLFESRLHTCERRASAPTKEPNWIELNGAISIEKSLETRVSTWNYFAFECSMKEGKANWIIK